MEFGRQSQDLFEAWRSRGLTASNGWILSHALDLHPLRPVGTASRRRTERAGAS